jgi:hypothetical protein
MAVKVQSTWLSVISEVVLLIFMMDKTPLELLIKSLTWFAVVSLL